MLVVTNPPLLPFLTVLAARIRGADSVLLVHDVYPDVMVATGMIRAGSIWERLGSRLNGWLYRTVDRVIVLGRDMAILAQRKMARATWHRIEVIPVWADTDSIVPEPKSSNALLHELGTGDAFAVQYAGNMGRPNYFSMRSSRRRRGCVPTPVCGWFFSAAGRGGAGSSWTCESEASGMSSCSRHGPAASSSCF